MISIAIVFEHMNVVNISYHPDLLMQQLNEINMQQLIYNLKWIFIYISVALI